MDRFHYELLIEEFAQKLSVSDDSTTFTEEHVFIQEESTDTSSEPDRRPIRLLVFDFDSTLFHSPLPSPTLWSSQLRGALISDCGWFAEPRTLLSPYIPEIPDEAWWDTSTLLAARQGLNQKHDTLTVLLTGRRHDRFSERIKQMCQSLAPPLNFDLFFFREGHDPTSPPHLHHPTTLDFKLSVLKTLLHHFPSIKHVEFWDDRKRHLELFGRELQSLQKRGRVESFDVHWVVHSGETVNCIPEELERGLVYEMVERTNERIKAARERERQGNGKVLEGGMTTEPESEGDPSNRDKDGVPFPCRLQRRTSASIFRSLLELVEEVRYTAIVLDPEDVDMLKRTFPPPDKTWSTRADHITINLGPAKDELVDPMGGIGARVTVDIVSIGEIPNKIQALKVTASTNTTLLSTNPIPHITLSFSPGTKPADSNLIPPSSYTLLPSPIRLTGTIKQATQTGLKTERAAPTTKKDVSIGELVMKWHPGLKGKEIGVVVKRVEEWMEKTFIENLGENRAVIEWFVQGLDVGGGGYGKGNGKEEGVNGKDGEAREEEGVNGEGNREEEFKVVSIDVDNE